MSEKTKKAEGKDLLVPFLEKFLKGGQEVIDIALRPFIKSSIERNFDSMKDQYERALINADRELLLQRQKIVELSKTTDNLGSAMSELLRLQAQKENIENSLRLCQKERELFL